MTSKSPPENKQPQGSRMISLNTDLCQYLRPTAHESLPDCTECIKSTLAYQDRGFPMLTQSPFLLPCKTSRKSASPTVPPAIQRRWLYLLYICFPGTSWVEFLTGGLPVPKWTVEGWDKSLEELPFLTQVTTNTISATAIIIHALYRHISHFPMSRAHQMMRLDSRPNALFPDRRRPCTVSCWQCETFLVAGVHNTGGVVSRHEAKLHVVDSYL